MANSNVGGLVGTLVGASIAMEFLNRMQHPRRKHKRNAKKGRHYVHSMFDYKKVRL